jgi:hypothetical protein
MAGHSKRWIGLRQGGAFRHAACLGPSPAFAECLFCLLSSWRSGARTSNGDASGSVGSPIRPLYRSLGTKCPRIVSFSDLPRARLCFAGALISATRRAELGTPACRPRGLLPHRHPVAVLAVIQALVVALLAGLCQRPEGDRRACEAQQDEEQGPGGDHPRHRLRPVQRSRQVCATRRVAFRRASSTVIQLPGLQGPGAQQYSSGR